MNTIGSIVYLMDHQLCIICDALRMLHKKMEMFTRNATLKFVNENQDRNIIYVSY